MADLVARARDLDRVLQQRYGAEPLAREFHERLAHAARALNGSGRG